MRRPGSRRSACVSSLVRPAVTSYAASERAEAQPSPLSAALLDPNRAAEGWYRDTLRQRYLEEALDFLAEDVERLGLGEGGWLADRRAAILAEECPAQDLRRLLSLVLYTQVPRDAVEPQDLKEAS
jgi:hypothetical protein